MLPVHTILHPTDFSEQSRNALRVAAALARDYGARLIILHVVPPTMVVYGEGLVPPEPDLILAAEQRQLDALELPHANVRAERRLVEGDEVAEILRVARECLADLIVLGTHGRSGISRLLMGSVAEPVVRRAGCPVLTVKNPVPETVFESEFVGAEAVNA